MRNELDRQLREALQGLAHSEGWSELLDMNPQLERTRDARHGDFSSNVAMRVAKSCGLKPREFAAALIARLDESTLIDEVNIAGPGFINFSLARRAYHDEIKRIVSAKDSYGVNSTGAGKRVLIEYVSANPTGPLHVGHGRHAAYGASLANLLRVTGHSVDEEYYINDAGRQMDILAISVWIRYATAHGCLVPFPANAYQGNYVQQIAAELSQQHGDTLLGDAYAVKNIVAATNAEDERLLDLLIAAIKTRTGEQRYQTVLDAALNTVLADIEQDLTQFGVRPQRWFSERSLAESGAIDKALDVLQSNDFLYVSDGATWFRSSDLGDDKDRVVVRENKAKTYFASDIAYHLDKCERGYDLLLNVLGSDHHGYVPRLHSSLDAMGKSREILEVQLVQFVILYRGTVKAQMSTRSGEYVTLRQLREEVGNDAARFFYVSRSNEQHLDFDLELAKSRSNDNPVYYVQYAHARIVSMLRRMQEQGMSIGELSEIDVALLGEIKEQQLMVALSRYPEILQLAADGRAPQHLVHYLKDLAATFHSFYDSHKILIDDGSLRDARTLLALATQQVICNALALLGVSAPDSM